jgi:hypothetical protein
MPPHHDQMTSDQVPEGAPKMSGLPAEFNLSQGVIETWEHHRSLQTTETEERKMNSPEPAGGSTKIVVVVVVVLDKM